MIWDLSIRIFHLLFAATIIAAYLTGENGALVWHERLGVTAVGLLSYRLIWGFWGPKPSRFINMVPSVSALTSYIQAVFKRTPPMFIGHNPLGALSVFAFILLALAISVTGLFSMDDIIYEAPLAYLVPDLSHDITKVHEALHDLVWPLIGLHLAAVAIHQFVFKEALIQRMVFGVDEKEMSFLASTQQSASESDTTVLNDLLDHQLSESQLAKTESENIESHQAAGIFLLGGCITLSWLIFLVLL